MSTSRFGTARGAGLSPPRRAGRTTGKGSNKAGLDEESMEEIKVCIFIISILYCFIIYGKRDMPLFCRYLSVSNMILIILKIS